MYDYPIASSSSSPPPSPQRHAHPPHHHVHRSHSPISHISTLLPHHHNNQHSAASRASDISRMLDPAYASGSSSSASSSCPTPTHRHKHGQTRAYVDRNGDLHDPDYRDFPVLPPSARVNASRRRRASNNSSRSRSLSRHPERYSSYSISRPEWERDWSTEVDDDDDDDNELIDDNESQSRCPPFASHVTTRRSATIHTTHNHSAHMPPYSRYVGEPQPIASSPAGSYETTSSSPSPSMADSPLQESPFLDERDEVDESFEEDRKAQRRSIAHSAILRRTSKKNESTANVIPADAEKSESAGQPQPQQFSLGNDIDNVPSCTDSLRQQWAAAMLRLRFGVFHAKRRLSESKRRRQSDAAR